MIVKFLVTANILLKHKLLKTIEEYSRYIEGLSKYIMVSLEVLEEELKNPKNYRTIHEIIKLEKVKNNWESKEYEKMLDIINSIN